MAKAKARNEDQASEIADAAQKQADTLKELVDNHTMTTDQGKVMEFAVCPSSNDIQFLPPRPRFDARDAQAMTRAKLDSIGFESELTRAIEEIKQAAGRGENRLNFQCQSGLTCYELIAKELRLSHFEVSGPMPYGGITTLSISWPK